MVFVFLCIPFTTVYAQDTQCKKEKDARVLQLTKDAQLTDLLQQFVVWQYNAHAHGLDSHKLNKALPSIDRSQTEK